MATSWPVPSRSRASTREWPPAPNVQSTISSPGCTSSSAPTSCASTGTCASGLGLGKTFGNTLGAPFDLGELAAPGLAVPDLEPVPQAGDDDVLGQLGVLEQRRRQRDAALAVELAVQRAAEEVALQEAAPPGEAVEPVALRVHVVVPAAGRPDRDAAVEPAGADDAVREVLSQPCGQRDAVLVVQPLLELTEEHTFPLTAPGWAPDLPVRTTLPHHSPHCNTEMRCS